jgi:uncharacterized membrane protein
MAHCTKCGAAVADNASFCAACGAPQGSPGAAPNAAAASPTTGSQMGENVAGLLSYVLGWITGLIFFLIDKRPFVRFHAAQSIVLFGGLNIVYFLVGGLFGVSLFAGGFSGFGFIWALYGLVDLAAFILWIVLMIKAYQGARFRVPIAADIADKIFGAS